MDGPRPLLPLFWQLEHRYRRYALTVTHIALVLGVSARSSTLDRWPGPGSFRVGRGSYTEQLVRYTCDPALRVYSQQLQNGPIALFR